MRANAGFLIAGVVFLTMGIIAGVGYLFDNYIRLGSTQIMGNVVSDISIGAQAAVDEALQTLDVIVAASPSYCTNTYKNSVGQSLQRASYVRQITVENSSGVRYCSALEGDFEFETFSTELSIPGRDEKLTSVRLAGSDVVLLRVKRILDRNRYISAFVNFSPVLTSGNLPKELEWTDILSVEFTEGTSLYQRGNPNVFDFSHPNDSHIYAIVFAGDIPIRVKAAVPFNSVRARRANLYVGVLLVISLLAGTFLFLAIKIIRGTKMPSFDLEQAIALHEIKPFYQPVIDLRTGKIAGCEVLARWKKPSGEIISPGVFIDYAEITGLAIPMTISLMEQVRTDLDTLCITYPGLKIAINLFEGHFRDNSIVHDVETIFHDSNISLRQLVFEITERHPLGDDSQAASVIGGLHAMGCRLAMDDVGTGHSNLAYIQKLGVDIIKIDQVFVATITEETTSSPVLDSLITMAQDLGAGIVAEGIETEAQALYLRARGVRDVQGFLFAPAIEADKYIEMVHLLNNGNEDDKLDEQGGADEQYAA